MLRFLRAIVWAQWRAVLHSRAGGRVWLAGVVSAIWYSLWALAAVAVFAVCSDPDVRLPGGWLLAYTAYWQIVPVMTMQAGVSLELKRLLIYPIPFRHLFFIEVALRVTAAFEMLLIGLGISLGLLWNPALPVWAPLGVVLLMLGNLLLSAGLRDLLARLFARRGVREALVLGIVLVSALPQFLIATGVPVVLPGGWWPWTAAARVSGGRAGFQPVTALVAWVVGAFAFARWQFTKSLRWDAAEASTSSGGTSRFGSLAGWIGGRLPDPLGALVEKDLRILSRSPRFRLLFLMGFTFGPLIWLPVALSGEGLLHSHFLTVVSWYALVLGGEVLFWNALGIDRSAASLYFVAPVNFQWILVGKNVVAALAIAMEFAVLTALSLLFGLPLGWARFGEVFCVLGVFGLLLMAVGNLMSVRYARPLDPATSWRGGKAGRTQFLMLLVYPLLAAPVALAYLARYSFESEWGFYGVIAFDFVLAASFYWVALESAADVPGDRREALLGSLLPTSGVT